MGETKNCANVKRMWFIKAKRTGNMKFGEKLSFLRKQSGMTQMELAEKLDVSRQAVSRWESGATFPSSGNIIKIGKLFNVSVNELIDQSASFRNGKAREMQERNKEEVKGSRKIFFLYNILFSMIVSLVIVSFAFGINRNLDRRVERDGNVQEQEEYIKTQNEIIFSKSWSADGVRIYVEGRDGTIEKIPEFSELFPDWDIPKMEANQEIDQSAGHFDNIYRKGEF